MNWNQTVFPSDELSYNALDLIECDHYKRVSPPRCYGEDEAAFWRRLDPVFHDWLRMLAEADPDRDLHVEKYAAYIVLTTCTGRMEYGEDAESLTWEGMTGHEMFFGALGMGGIHMETTGSKLVSFMLSFIQHLGQVGEIPKEDYEYLTEDIGLWALRIVAYFDAGGPWYETASSDSAMPQEGDTTSSLPHFTEWQKAS